MGVESVGNIQAKSRLNIARLKIFTYQIKKKITIQQNTWVWACYLS